MATITHYRGQCRTLLPAWKININIRASHKLL